MIALARKNLVCLISTHNSFVCKSPISLHFFSTTNPKIYDLLLHKHHFSHNLASLIAAQLKKPEKADSVLSFLKESGCSSAQLEKIVKYEPQILSASVEGIKFKIKIIQHSGLSSVEVAKLISTNQAILHLSAKNKIIPSLSLLKTLLGSDCNVARVLRRSGWVLTTDLERTLMPNIEILKSCGVTMERIIWLFYTWPRSLLIKPDVMRNSVEKAKEMGFCPSSNMFVHAIRVITSMRKGAWELKWQDFRDLGFSDSEISAILKKAPNVFNISKEKVEKIKELLLATGKFNLLSIVNNPSSLTCSIEKRFKPRLRILGILESQNLIRKWPGLGKIYRMPDDKFYERYSVPFSNVVGEKELSQGNRDSKL